MAALPQATSTGGAASADLTKKVLELEADLDKALTIQNTKSDEGTCFNTLLEFWRSEAAGIPTWYERGDQYWSVSSL